MEQPYDTERGAVHAFLLKKLPADVVEAVLRELESLKGFKMNNYSEDEIDLVAAKIRNGPLGSYRHYLDISRGLIRLHDGVDKWSSTVSSCSSQSVADDEVVVDVGLGSMQSHVDGATGFCLQEVSAIATNSIGQHEDGAADIEETIADAVSTGVVDSFAVFSQGEVPVSSAVLRLASPVFDAMYSARATEPRPFRFRVEHGSKDAFVEFYKCLLPLQGSSAVTEEHMESVLSLAEYYKVNAEALKNDCSPRINARFQSAVLASEFSLARQCLKFGADPNMRQSDGYTLLHLCAVHGADGNPFGDEPWKDQVKFAIESGCDITIRDAKGMTALDLLENLVQSARDALLNKDDSGLRLVLWKNREEYMRREARTKEFAARLFCEASGARRRAAKH